MMAAMSNLIITPAETGLTGLEVLEKRIPAAPAAYLRQLFRQGKILLAGNPVTAGTVLRCGDQLVLPGSDRLKDLIEASQKMTVEILLENPLWMAVYKPAGLAVHRGTGHEGDNLTNRVQAWLRNLREPFRAFPVHRLDAGTSGPVLYAKGRQAAGALGRALMAGELEKSYLALAPGRLPDEGLLASPVPAKGKLKEAATRYRVLAANPEYMLLQLELLSGRNHQIRRQMADAGHPLAGDQRYGGPALPGLDRPFLHCCRLVWPDPESAARQCVTCPLPEDLTRALTALGLEIPALIEKNGLFSAP
jgi:23S rRNA-/tRNA-specific pseudouridylate synthase